MRVLALNSFEILGSQMHIGKGRQYQKTLEKKGAKLHLTLLLFITKNHFPKSAGYWGAEMCRKSQPMQQRVSNSKAPDLSPCGKLLQRIRRGFFPPLYLTCPTNSHRSSCQVLYVTGKMWCILFPKISISHIESR